MLAKAPRLLAELFEELGDDGVHQQDRRLLHGLSGLEGAVHCVDVPLEVHAVVLVLLARQPASLAWLPHWRLWATKSLHDFE